MLLKSLEIQGFKSFPDKTLLKFDKGITAVVGPNGSGKSNISDAIRWVLGEISSKALRGTKMEDVIFGGTVDRKPLGFAEVSLSLENTDRSLNFDSDEVKITRRFFRSGESEYLLNGNDVRLKDIHELLMDTGIGRDGYSIIGQGRIDEIVGAKSEDRREIFEEASGISKYRYRKEDSERRLADAEENLVRLRDILNELESRVGPLREQSEKAKKYIDLAGEKKTLEVGLWLNTLDRQRDVLREHEKRLEYSQAQYDSTCEKLDKIQTEIEGAYLETQRRAAQIEECRKEAQELEDAAVKKQGQADILKNDITHNNENIERIKSEIDQAEKSSSVNDEETKRIIAELEEKKTKSADVATLLENCENGVLDISKKSENLSGEMQSIAETITTLTLKLNDARIEKNGAELSVAHITERAESIDNDIAVRNERIKEAEKELAGCRERAEECSDKIESLNNELKGYELKYNTKNERLKRLDETVRSFTLQYDGKKQRANMLEDMEKNLEGFSLSVKRVMKEKEHGGLGGIHAPVSKIISVPQQYALAVETALGFSAQHIVVDSERDAKEAISLLKRTDGGRATFLPITSVKGHIITERGLDAENGFCGIASELVSTKPEYDGIVKSLLGRTVITEDLDCAVAIAKRYSYRFRIVTLDGQLVNAGGSMTGGSTGKNTGLLSRAGDIAELRRQADEIKARIDGLSSERSTLCEQISSLNASLTDIKSEIATACEDKIRCEAETLKYTEQIASAKADIATLEKERSDSDEKVVAFKKTAAEDEIKIAELSLKIEEAQKKAEALGVDKSNLAAMQEERSKKLSSLRLEALTLEKDAEALSQQLQNIVNLRENGKQRVVELQGQITLYEDRTKEALSNIEGLDKEAAALREEAGKKSAGSEEISKQREEAEHKTLALRTDERSLSDDKEKISEEIARLDERKTTAQNEYDGIIAKLLDEYEMTRTEAEKAVPKVENVPEAQKRLNHVKNSIKALGSVNVDAIEEYKEVSERYEFLKTQINDVEKSKRELTSIIGDLTSNMRDIFAEQFELINKNFSETFADLFGGGMGRLEFSEPDDILSSGIEIIVQPPGKIIKSLSMLSGGERAFVAIALYFAILKVRPSPFCVLDEIEAALDDGNITRFTDYLHRMCGETQFIVITHRRITMDSANTIYGVTMQDEGVSKLLTLHLEELVKKLGIK